MNQLEIALIVAAQIVVFQFISLAFARAVGVYLVGAWALPDEVVLATESHRRRATRFRCSAGVLLLLALVTCSWPGVLADTQAKLALAVISLISSAVLIVGFAHDRAALASIAATLPEPRFRVAILDRHTLATYYSPAWEFVPLAVWLGTLAVLIWAVSKAEAPTWIDIVSVPLVQLIWIVGSFAMVQWKVRVGGKLSQRARTHLGSSEHSAVVSESLKGLELQFFMLARIVITLLLGLQLSDRITTALGPAITEACSTLTWALVVLLLLAFASFMIVVSALQSKLLRRIN